jgi:hypothetical protein
METISRKVDDLSQPDRAALEHLLGRQLEQDQQVVVMAFKPCETDASVREAARMRLHASLDRAARHAADLGITTDEADAAIAEAMEAIRHRPRN